MFLYLKYNSKCCSGGHLVRNEKTIDRNGNSTLVESHFVGAFLYNSYIIAINYHLCSVLTNLLFHTIPPVLDVIPWPHRVGRGVID